MGIISTISVLIMVWLIINQSEELMVGAIVTSILLLTSWQSRKHGEVVIDGQTVTMPKGGWFRKGTFCFTYNEVCLIRSRGDNSSFLLIKDFEERYIVSWAMLTAEDYTRLFNFLFSKGYEEKEDWPSLGLASKPKKTLKIIILGFVVIFAGVFTLIKWNTSASSFKNMLLILGCLALIFLVLSFVFVKFQGWVKNNLYDNNDPIKRYRTEMGGWGVLVLIIFVTVALILFTSF